MPTAVFNDFFLYVALGIFGFHLLINIFAYLKIRELTWTKYVLNVFDGLLVFSAVAFFVFLIITAINNVGESGFIFLFFPMAGGILFLGTLGLYFTNSKPSQPGSAKEKGETQGGLQLK